MKQNFKPTLPADRIEQVDILRGVALFGILLVNVFGYQASFYDFGGFYSQLTDPFEKEVYRWVIGLGADKFIFLFSMLFGLGFYMLMAKSWSASNSFSAFYTRRMAALAMFGALHILFLWAGDILLMYSILGLILLSIRKWNSKVLIVMMFFFYYFISIFLLLKNAFPFLPDPLSSTSNLGQDQILETYSQGNYFDVMRLRINEYITFRNINIFYYAPKVMALFIAGYLTGKGNLIGYVRKSGWAVWLVALIFLTTGLLFFFNLDDWTGKIVNPESSVFFGFYMFAYETGNIFLGLSYFMMIIMVAGTIPGRFLLVHLSFVGRMSLTNYLLQSLVFTTIFYGYGLGCFGTTDPSTFVLWAVILFIVQVIASKIWLFYHRYGPVEWLWRRISYGKMK